MLWALLWQANAPAVGWVRRPGRPPSMAHEALQGALPGRRVLRRRATLPGRIKHRRQPIGRIPATIDAGRVVDKAPLVLGRPDRTERLPDRRGRLVKLPQRFGDHRPLLFEHRDCDREVGPDVVWDRVGRVAWLGHASTSSLDNAWPTSPFRLSPDSTGQRS